jgi:hypothetical protein
MDNFKFVLQYECKMGQTRTMLFSSRELLDKFTRRDEVYRVWGIWELGKRIL